MKYKSIVVNKVVWGKLWGKLEESIEEKYLLYKVVN